MENDSSSFTYNEELSVRFISKKDEILRFINELEQVYGIPLFPREPKPESGHPGIVRVYLRIPFKRPPLRVVKKGARLDE